MKNTPHPPTPPVFWAVLSAADLRIIHACLAEIAARHGDSATLAALDAITGILATARRE